MKFLLILVSIIAVLTVDGRDFPNEYGGLDSSPGVTEKYAHDFYSNQNRHIKPKPGYRCSAKDICIIMGGSCTTNPRGCTGRLVPGCKGKHCECCIPDTLETTIKNLEQKLQTMQANITNAVSEMLSKRCPVGFFRTAGSSQCYKYYTDARRSWTEAKGKCQSEGFVLAEPANPISLRKYLVDTYGTRTEAHAHIGARGTGSYLTWDHSGQKISNSDSLWYTSHPVDRVSTSYCLVMLVDRNNYFAKHPNQPYWSGNCAYQRFTICEYV